MSFTDDFDWLSDLTRREEIQQWIASHGLDFDQILQWARSHETYNPDYGTERAVFDSRTLPLDIFKDSIDDKYDIYDALSWRYHSQDGEPIGTIQKRLPPYREIAEGHDGELFLLGVDEQGVVHVSYSGNCGTCELLESNTLKNLSDELEHIDGVAGVINDGKVSAERTNNSRGLYEEPGTTPVAIQPRELLPPS